jgi:hypothetical protein
VISGIRVEAGEVHGAAAKLQGQIEEGHKCALIPPLITFVDWEHENYVFRFIRFCVMSLPHKVAGCIPKRFTRYF